MFENVHYNNGFYLILYVHKNMDRCDENKQLVEKWGKLRFLLIHFWMLRGPTQMMSSNIASVTEAIFHQLLRLYATHEI